MAVEAAVEAQLGVPGERLPRGRRARPMTPHVVEATSEVDADAVPARVVHHEKNCLAPIS